MSTWSITESDVLTITLKYGDLEYAIRKSDMYYESYESYTILATFNKFVYNKFVVNPRDIVPTCYMLDWKDCTFPIATDRDNLLEQLIKMLQSGSDTKVQKNGVDVGQEPTLNFIEGSNITITAVDDPTNNKVDVTIAASGGGGGTVTAVTGTSPISSSGGTTPDISIQQASGTQAGYLSSTDWTTFNSKGNGTVTGVTATGLLTSSGGATPDISSFVNKDRLVGRGPVAGIMEEITVGSGLSLSGTTLSNSSPFTTPLTTKGDIYTRNASVDTRLPVGLDTQVLIADSSATTGLKWGSNTAPTPTGYYGAFQDNVTQTAVASNVGYAMILRTVDLSNGISVVTNGTNLTRITFANTGIYNLQFSSQFQNVDNAEHDVTIWLRLNGTDVAGSAGFVQVPKRKAAGAGNEGHVVVSWNYVLSVVAGQYYELMWSTTNHTNVTMQFYAAGSPPPSSASVILTVTQQSGIMAGTGITAINSLTGAAQTLVAGTSGTTFDISSSGTTHTFNLPTASATNRGALSSTDWTTFNSKPNYVTAANWNLGVQGGGSLSTLALPLNVIKFYKIYIANAITVTRLGCNVTIGGTAGSRGRMGIYSDVNGYPSALILDSGEFTADVIAPKLLTGLSGTLPAGVAWLCIVHNSAANVTFNSHPVSNLYPLGSLQPGGGLNANLTHYSGTFTYAALPSNTSALTLSLLSTSVPAIYFYS